MTKRNCALCGSVDFETVIDLGFHPCADTFVYEKKLREPEIRYPLKLAKCVTCGHAQLTYLVPPEVRYQATDYSYDSSNSPVSIGHFNEMASDVSRFTGLTSKDLVCDVGSNIGTLLNGFSLAIDCKTIGIDPSGNISALANSLGVHTVNDFFCRSSADEVLKFGRPRIITATNVLNHAEDVSHFFDVAEYLIDQEGYIVIETPYLLELIKNSAFDTIYLEHVNYFSVTPLARFLEARQMGIVKIEVSDYMLGTIRMYIKPKSPHGSDVEYYKDLEEKAKLFSLQVYSDFMLRIRNLKIDLNNRLYEIRASGGRVFGIGAATKGNTLLNYCNIDSDLLEFISDTSKLKVGKFTPGSHIKIISDESIPKGFTHGLILPWNIADYLQNKLKDLHVEFIVPLMEKK